MPYLLSIPVVMEQLVAPENNYMYSCYEALMLLVELRWKMMMSHVSIHQSASESRSYDGCSFCHRQLNLFKTQDNRRKAD